VRREASGAHLKKEGNIPGKQRTKSIDTTDGEAGGPQGGGGAKTTTQTKLEEIAARREALRKKYLARSHTESSIAIERKERFQRQGFNEGKGSDDVIEPDNVSAEHLLSQIVNRTDALGSSKDERPKKKKILLKNSGGETPPVLRKRQGEDVKKILRRLSLNIPPPTPEEIEEQGKKGQNLTEENRKEVNLENRKKTLDNYRGTSTEEKPTTTLRKGNSFHLPGGGLAALRMDKQRPRSSVEPGNELDQIIAKGANDTNLKTFNEKKFNERMRNELPSSRSSSVDHTSAGGKSISQKVTALVQANVEGKSEKVVKEGRPLGRRHSLCIDRFEAYDSPKMLRRESTMTDSPLMSRKTDFSDPSSRRSFHRNTEWLSTLVDEAVAESGTIMPLVPKAPERTERQKSAISLRDIKQNVDTESIRSALPERKMWLEQVAKRNSLKSSGGRPDRLAKTKSLCNLSNMDMDDDMMMTLLDLEKPLSRQVSVEDIRQSIDLENRGSAYMLPSDIKRRSMNMGDFMDNLKSSTTNLNNNNNNDNNTGNNTPVRSRANTIGGGERRTADSGAVNGHGEKYVDKELGMEFTDEELTEALEAIELPNIQERMKMFQPREKETDGTSPFVRLRKPTKARTINRKQRPKSYAGEHLSQMVLENGVFRNKEEPTSNGTEHNNNNNNNNNRATAASLGKALMADSNSDADDNDNTNHNNNNHSNHNKHNNNDISNDNNRINNNNNIINNEDNINDNNDCVNNGKNKRTNRRSLYANQRILAEIAEMENREAEIMEDREPRRGSMPDHVRNGTTTTTTTTTTGVTLRRNVKSAGFEGKVANYPKGLKKFLKENEVRR